MPRILLTVLAAMALSVASFSAHAEELNLEASLIWGANDQKEPVKLKAVDAPLSDKLHHTFKWHNYYEITNKFAEIPLNQSRDLQMSDSCTIRVKNIGNSRIEVNCIGRGKNVHKGAYTLDSSQWLVLAGHSTDNTAWFVGLRPVEKAVADATR
jgi:hypothetical protein